MDRNIAEFPGARLLFGAAAIVIIVAGMRAASPILVPFLLSLFIAIICAPPLFWLQRKGVPTVFAVLLVIVGIMGIGGAIATVVGTSVNDFSRALPLYQRRLQELVTGLLLWVEGLGVDVPEQVLLEYLNPGAAIKLVAGILTGLSGMLTNTFLILLTVIFILLEAWSFPARLRSALSDPEHSLPYLDKFVDNVKRYMTIKTLVSLLTGAFITLWLMTLRVDFALLWGLLAFMFNYVPNLGSIIAAVPAVLLALIQLGIGPAILVALGYLVVNVVMGSFLEPRFMGRGLGLSTLVVFLSLVFWGWVLGPVGMVLSVPLTVTLKIALESSERTNRIAILLGSRGPVEAVSTAPSAQAPDESVDSEPPGDKSSAA